MEAASNLGNLLPDYTAQQQKTAILLHEIRADNGAQALNSATSKHSL
jgi:hypothetical protein